MGTFFSNNIIWIIIGLLAVVSTVLFVRVFQYKTQMKMFAELTKKRLTEDVNSPVNVEYFSKDIVELARVLNLYTDKMKENNILLEEDRRQLKKLIVGISHDFRTPLTAARGYLQLIEKNGELDEKNSEYLQISINKIDYLKTLSDAFFEVSTIDAKDEQVEVSTLDIVELVTENLMGQYDWVKERNIEADINLPEKRIEVTSNKEFLNRILDNLFSNARKYTLSKLGVSITEEKEHVYIKIENDFENEGTLDVNKIFDLFYRSNSRTKEGSGIGLYIVKTMSEKLGHIVTAECVDNNLTITICI